MEKQLTDVEIKKALECYRNSKIIQVENGVISIGDILDLINRQQAENERLKYFNSANVASAIGLENKLETAKAEAYKEIEEKIDKITWYHINKNGKLVMGANSETDIPLYKAKDVYNLLKELGGE
jgi:hypothetical protein